MSRSDVHGRPGLNPLTLTKDKVATITPAIARVLSGFNRLRGRRWENPERNSFKIGRIHFRIGEKLKFVTGRRIIGPDQAANLGAIREAASHADITLASVHAHKHGNWLREFARTAIAEGADIIFVHGPHKIRGIELHDGKPIFYGMGNFVFQSDQITRLPSEAYERFRLGDDATAKDLLIARSKAGLSLFDMRSSFEAYAAVLEYQGGKVTKIRLLPLDLQFDAGQDTRGQPRFADPRLGKDIIGRVAELSSQYSTEIHYHSGSNCGIVELA